MLSTERSESAGSQYEWTDPAQFASVVARIQSLLKGLW